MPNADWYQFAGGALIQRLRLLQEAAGQRPGPLEWFKPPADQQDAEIILHDREEADIGRYRRAGVVVAVLGHGIGVLTTLSL